VFANLKDIETQGWVGLRCFVQVHRRVEHKGKTTEERAYFISSLPHTTSAAEFAKGIRGHWGVEAMHYTKDVTFKEDVSRIRTKQAPENLSLMRNMVMNLFLHKGYTNMARAIRMVAHDIPVLWGIVSA
jgi:predicted transposase YbfD/YdcC